MRHLTTIRPLALLCFAIGSCMAGVTAGTAQVAVDMDDLLAVMERLAISVPMKVAGSDPIRRHLGELSREKCDQKAVADLGDALDKAGYRREAATAHIRFSNTCGGHAASLGAATNILLKLSDYPGAIRVASNLIELEPYRYNGYYLRAMAHDRSGAAEKAIDDYITAIELYANKEKMSSGAHVALGRSYEKLGRFCDAMTSVESWVALNPTQNDTSQMRAIVADYMKRGNCTIPVGKEEVFPISRQSHARLQVSVNGVRGNFILDTGATWVSLKNAFAQKAKVQIDQESKVRLHTANGMGEGKRGRARLIQVRSLQPKDVPIVVQDDGKGSYGDGVDGLLGMSFLSRFKVTVDAREVKIAPRSGR
jgi:clan AA aspartic protease (TIGR02281 family)